MEKVQDDIIGKRIGIYDVLYECDYKSTDNHRLFHVKCYKCGWETDMQKRHIRMTHQCHHTNVIGRYVLNYKFDNKTLCHIYKGILTRCYNKNDASYRFYGQKGIKVCYEWLNDPKSFENWSLQNGYKCGLTIDRIDPYKDYSPDNCRWVTASYNSKYKSTTKITTVNGLSYTGREWAKILGLGTNTINLMLRNYPEEKVKEFINRRMQDKTVHRHSRKTWMESYGL